MRKVSYLIVLLLLAAIMAPASCKDTGDVISRTGDIISGTGTVTYVDLEGGFYGITGDDGECYEPINLSQEYQVDCLPVSFTAKIRHDVTSTHMWGTIIEITKIEALGGG